MMNNGHNGPPNVPIYPGRRHHEMPYHQPPSTHYPHQYHPYHPQQPHLAQNYHPQPPQPHWAYYQNMQPPMSRQYAPYPQTMIAPYPMAQNPTSMSSRPGPQQHVPPPPNSFRPQQAMISPPPPDRVLHPPPSPQVAMPSPPPAPPPPPPPTQRMPFYPPLPWFSVPGQDFPSTQSKRRRRRPLPQSQSHPVELPTLIHTSGTAATNEHEALSTISSPSNAESYARTSQITPSLEPNHSDTTATSQAPSESDSTQPTTPSSAVPPRATASGSNSRKGGKILPVVPVIPNLPSLSRHSKGNTTSISSDLGKPVENVSDTGDSTRPADGGSEQSVPEGSVASTETSKPASPQTRPPPKSWADLVRTKGSVPLSSNNGNAVIGSPANSLHLNKSDSVAGVLNKFEVKLNGSDNKISFLKPRGLVNTGNMCYMNSVLQILVFCVPFHDFLEQVSKHAAYSFKSDTPMVDAMIDFLREFPTIDAAVSAEQLRMRLKDSELEEYGEAFIPEFVYEVIRRLPRFSSMRRGHQQDAEEFLGFLLEEMHEECVKIMKGLTPSTALTATDDIKSPTSETASSEDNGWLEVGPKQRAAVTRSSGMIATESPITKIFGGKLRSELRVPGAKNSVTLEPYQPLQLDIGSPQITNITDALKGLTSSEKLHGDFNSPRGPGVSATKQVFIEALPPILILHLKRFQYDNAGGTQKIWKKIGYPLDLEIPKEVFPQHKRGGFAVHGGLPKYRLTGVVYHHGKSASGGHYTVDIRRQDGREWIRLDDTVIRRVRAEDVAEGGSEEDPKILAAALEQHKHDSNPSNIYDQVREEQEESAQAEKGWSHVNGSTSSGGSAASKKWSGVVNGTATPATSSGKMTPVGRYSVKDNKVAYLLFYEKVG